MSSQCCLPAVGRTEEAWVHEPPCATSDLERGRPVLGTPFTSWQRFSSCFWRARRTVVSSSGAAVGPALPCHLSHPTASLPS